MFRIVLVVIFLGLFLSPVTLHLIGIDQAQAGITDGLTDAQKTKLVLEAAKMKADSAAALEKAEKLALEGPPPPSVSVQEVAEWAALGKEFGAAIAGTAKELGMVVNDFLTTPTGLLIAGVLVWKLIGLDIIGLVFGTIWLIVAYTIWYKMLRKIAIVKKINYETTDKGKRIVASIEHYQKGETSEAGIVLLTISFLIIGAVGLMTIFV